MSAEVFLEEGVVIGLENGRAIVVLTGSDQCEQCSLHHHCKPAGPDGRSLIAVDPLGVHPGDKVQVMVLGRNILLATTLLYGIPLVLLLVGIFVGLALFKTNIELYSSLLGLGLMGVYALALFLRGKFGRNQDNLIPKIVSRSS
ncbi:MAG TPA: SoxR reducing system RseC family protein [Levilinea sp.]|nr:SoxR reducing system RseC family protein [Levilinea sp.]